MLTLHSLCILTAPLGTNSGPVAPRLRPISSVSSRESGSVRSDEGSDEGSITSAVSNQQLRSPLEVM